MAEYGMISPNPKNSGKANGKHPKASKTPQQPAAKPEQTTAAAANDHATGENDPNPLPAWLSSKGGDLSRSDIGLIKRAFTDRFPVRPEYRQEMIDLLAKMAFGKDTRSDRTRLSAVRALIAADKLNVEAIVAQVGADNDGKALDVVKAVGEISNSPEFQAFVRNRLASPPEGGNGDAAANANGNGATHHNGNGAT